MKQRISAILKFLMLAGVCLFVYHPLGAQWGISKAAGRPVYFSASYGQFDIANANFHRAYGVNMRVFVTKRISFDTDLQFGKGFAQFGLGLMSLPVVTFLGGKDLLTGTLSSGDFYMFGLLCLAAEHTTYHIPVAKNFDVSPYICLLREKIVEGHDQLYYAGGLELNMYFKNWVFTPYIDTDRAYWKNEPNNKFRTNIGLHLGRYMD